MASRLTRNQLPVLPVVGSNPMSSAPTKKRTRKSPFLFLKIDGKFFAAEFKGDLGPNPAAVFYFTSHSYTPPAQFFWDWISTRSAVVEISSNVVSFHLKYSTPKPLGFGTGSHFPSVVL